MIKNPWIIFWILLFISLQFFYVLFKYETIESEKVFWWVILYFLPIYAILLFFPNRSFTKLLFYSSPTYQPSDLNKIDRLKNLSASFGLSITMISFFSYNTIILTNDWFGSGKHELLRSKVQEVKYSNVRRTKSTGSGNPKWIITVKFHNEMIKLTTHKPWFIGEKVEINLNTGGLWGIKFVD